MRDTEIFKHTHSLTEVRHSSCWAVIYSRKQTPIPSTLLLSLSLSLSLYVCVFIFIYLCTPTIYPIQVFSNRTSMRTKLESVREEEKKLELVLQWLEENDKWLLVVEDANSESQDLVREIASRGKGKLLVTSVADFGLNLEGKNSTSLLSVPLSGFSSADDCKRYWSLMKVSVLLFRMVCLLLDLFLFSSHSTIPNPCAELQTC